MISVLNRPQKILVRLGEHLHFSFLVCDQLFSNPDCSNLFFRSTTTGDRVKKPSDKGIDNRARQLSTPEAR
jgi:hypothetical protein